MANEFVTATKKGELSKVKGYDTYGGLRVRHVLTGVADYSLDFIEIPTLPEMMKITATAEVKVVFANDAKQAKNTVVIPTPVDPQNPTQQELDDIAEAEADIAELEKLGIDNIGLDDREDVIVVPAGETFTYRKRHEKFIAFKGGAGFFEAW